MRPEWPTTALGALAERMTSKNSEGNGNVLTISARHGLVSQRDYFNKTVASENLSNYYLLRRGDFAYNKSYSDGYPVGAIKRLDRYEAGVVSPLYICFRLLQEERIESNFLVHLFESGLLDAEIRAIAKEGARNHGLLNVKVSDFFGIPIPLPALEEQRKIAAILSAVDDAIEATQAVIDQLLVVKKAMTAELLMRGLPGRHPRFKHTEIGHVPESWDVERLENLTLLITKGESPRWQGFEYQSAGVLFVTSENVRDGSLDLSVPKFIPPAFGAKLRRSRLQAGDVLVNIVGASIGRAALWEGQFNDANVNQAVAVIRPNPARLIPRLVLDALYSPRGQDYFGTSKVDNARPNVSLTNLRDFPMVVPPPEEQAEIAAVAAGLDARLAAESASHDQLRTAKAALTSALLTGAVRVVPGDVFA